MWKIKTSKNKFKILPLAQYKILDITINDKIIGKSKEGTMFGLKMQSAGITGHVTYKINKTSAAPTKVYRFASPEIKITLVKAILLPILKYQQVPLA